MEVTEAEQRNVRITIGVTTSLLALATLSYILRIASRLSSVASFWYDDYFGAFVLFICIAMSTQDYLGLRFGSGMLQESLSQDSIRSFIINLYTYEILWSVGVFAVKIVILLFYLRVFSVPSFRKVLWAVFGVSLAIFLVNLFGHMLQCIPIQYFWDPTGDGYCFDQGMFYMSSAIINVLGDIVVLVAPIPQLWRLHATKSRRIALILVFTVGGLVCVASLFRIIALTEIDFEDVTFTNIAAGLWSTVEVDLGFTAANLPAVWSLVRRVFCKDQNRDTYPPRSYERSHPHFRSSASTNSIRLMPDECHGDTVTLTKSERMSRSRVEGPVAPIPLSPLGRIGAEARPGQGVSPVSSERTADYEQAAGYEQGRHGGFGR